MEVRIGAGRRIRDHGGAGYYVPALAGLAGLAEYAQVRWAQRDGAIHRRARHRPRELWLWLGGVQAVQPPSLVITAPFTLDASGEDSHEMSVATSSGSATRSQSRCIRLSRL